MVEDFSCNADNSRTKCNESSCHGCGSCRPHGCLPHSGQVDLTLISDKFSPHTVSDKSGMIFSLLYHKDAISYQQESEERYKRWICSSFNTFQSIFKSPDNALKFMVLLSGEVLSQSLGGKTTYLVSDVWGWILLRPNPSVSLQTVQKHGAMTHTP